MLLSTLPSYTRYQCTFPIATLHFTTPCPTLSHHTGPFIPYSIPSYPLHTFYTHVSLAFTYYPILPYHTLPYSTLNYFTLSLLKLTKITRGRNDAGQKRLVLLGQIDLPSGDKAETTRRKRLMAQRWHQAVLVTRDFGRRSGAADVSSSRWFSSKPLNTPRRFGTKTFQHQNISTQDGWMDGWMGR